MGDLKRAVTVARIWGLRYGRFMSDSRTPAGQEDTDFGYARVSPGDKPALVRGVFESVAPRYDLMNDLMSGGLHRLWKRSLIAAVRPRPGTHVVDVAGGTGDIAFAYLDRANRQAHTTIAAAAAHATIVDATQAMLSVGRDRGLDRGLVHGIDWVCGTGEALPLADGCADTYTCAFGLRNMTDLAGALAEARRVLKPGGRFAALEFSAVDKPVLARLYDAYSFAVLPRLGQIVAGDGEAYTYLAESIRRFPGPSVFVPMIEAAGLDRVTPRGLSAGIVTLYLAWRL
jgi:demethylmenaquinone methyltransferase/2-methoxy-6-polyprenyl-1,4-benzoquinol methylase